jgi:prolyl oligopeptidase PreP (S9A serine peptidase family)
LDNEGLFKNVSFWKELLSDSQKTVLLTGIAEYTEEIRKAILRTKKKRSDDTFSREGDVEERRFYTLNLSLFLIDSQTGEPLYTQAFKETQGYKNPKQTGPFAFFDVAEKVKGKFFNQILGRVTSQQRFLILR